MSQATPDSATGTPAIDYEAIEHSEKFQQLKRTHRSFVFPVAIAFLLWYIAYVLLADYARDFMATPVFGNINVGLLMGLGQFVTTFAVTTWYVSFANRRLDPLAADLRDDLAALEASAGSAAK